MTRWFACLCFALGVCASAPAWAQLGLPLPEVPVVGGVLERAEDLPVDQVIERARDMRVRDLLRAHPRELERDPDGEAIVRSQILALGMSGDALARARESGFEVVARDALGGAGEMLTLRAPPRMSTRRALRTLREGDPHGVYDFDHLHLESGDAQSEGAGGVGSHGARIGLIDGGVDTSDFRGAVVEQRAFAGSQPTPSMHANAVASLLRSSAPAARLYVADIYGGAPVGGASSALARALTWLLSERTPVINISLVGPRNRIVEAVVAQAVSAGHLVVAAVGNDGPAAPPLYPAAYPGVVGVTGVDLRGRILPEAARGAQVDFAALGMPQIGSRRARGTSFAAPIVTALLAERLSTPDARGAEQAVSALRTEARDLGARGRDDVYGYGLVALQPGVAAR